MATLSELIAQHCADLTDYEAIAARLNAPTIIDNPQTEPAHASTMTAMCSTTSISFCRHTTTNCDGGADDADAGAGVTPADHPPYRREMRLKGA